MKKRNAGILGSLILGIILSCAGGAAAQTVWVACVFDTTADVPVKGRPAKFERRMYVSDVVSMSTRDFLESDKADGRIAGNCESYLHKTVLKGADARGEKVYSDGSLQIFQNIQMSNRSLETGQDPYVYAPKEAVEKLRDDFVKSWQSLDRIVYKFNWDPSGSNESADLQRETSGVAPVSQIGNNPNSVDPQLQNTDDGGDIKDRISSLITLPATQIPLKQPKFLVVNELKDDANYVLSSNDLADILKKDQIEDSDFQDASADGRRAESALQKLKMLFEAGTPATEIIELKNGNLSLGELAEMLLKINRDATSIVTIHNLEQDTMRVLVWSGDIGKGQLRGADLYAAQRSGEELQKRVSEAQKLGFPDDYKLNVQDHDYTLPDLREMGRYVATAGAQIQAGVDAARAAKDAPYLKILSGDKARIFTEEFGGQDGMWEAYGSGGKILNTPAAMSGATVWFTYGNSRGIIDTWHITGYRFSGDKLVERISRSGYGLKPSAAAFR